MASRPDVLKGVVNVFVNNSVLVAYVGNASKIYGFDVKRTPSYKSIVVAIGGEDRPSRRPKEQIEWGLRLFVYAKTALEIAEMLDLIDDAIEDYVTSGGGPFGINGLLVGGHESFILESNDPLVGVEVSLEVSFIRS